MLDQNKKILKMDSFSIVKPEKGTQAKELPPHPQVPQTHTPHANSTPRTENHIECNDREGGNAHENKRRRLDLESAEYVLSPGFLDLLPSLSVVSPTSSSTTTSCVATKSCKQFWKAGNYEVSRSTSFSSGGLDHIRVHPKFLHSNATSHKWAHGGSPLWRHEPDAGMTYIIDILPVLRVIWLAMEH